MKLFYGRMTIRRLYNVALVIFEMFFKKTRLNSKPIIAKIEASSACNLLCLGCRSGEKNELVEYPSKNLSTSDFKIMLDKMGDYLFEVVFYLWGEPLINKNLPQLVKMAHEKNISVVISTNLHYLTEKMGNELILAELDKIIFCIDGWSQQTYEEVRIKGNFELVKKNISNFIKARNSAGYKKPYLEWQYIVTEKNISELIYAKKAASEWGIDKFSEIVDWEKRLKQDYFKGLKKAKEKRRKNINKCYWLWSSIAIQVDGNVFPCCHVANKLERRRIYGNILEESFESVWNSEMYRKARLFLKSKRTISDGDFICQRCVSPPVFVNMKKNGSSPKCGGNPNM